MENKNAPTECNSNIVQQLQHVQKGKRTMDGFDNVGASVNVQRHHNFHVKRGHNGKILVKAPYLRHAGGLTKIQRRADGR
jgi:hypothetical protein